MEYGNKAVYGEPLILVREEKERILATFPEAQSFIRPLKGAKEFLNGLERWVIWIENEKLLSAKAILPIKERIEKVKALRLASSDSGAQELAQSPHRFRDTKTSKTTSLIVPLTTSERRKYIPTGFLSKEVVLTNATNAIYDAEPWIFGVISSLMHMVWMRTIAGRLKTDYRYSSVLCYNTFPFPDISQKQKDEIIPTEAKVILNQATSTIHIYTTGIFNKAMDLMKSHSKDFFEALLNE